MATQTTTEIELQEFSQPSHANLNVDEKALPQSSSHPTLDENFIPSEPLNIVEASNLADSTVPEGGYGWVVIAGCAVVTWWYLGMSYSWGIMQLALVDRGLASASTLSFVGSLCASFNGLLGMVNARFIKSWGTRKAGLLGVSCLGLGAVLSGFCTENIGGLFITGGVIMGVGTSLSFMLVSVAPSQYFSKKRGLAIGIIYASGGLGGTIITVAMNALIEKVGPAWTFRIIGLMILATGLPAAWLIKERVPIKKNSFIDISLLHNSQFIILFAAGALSTFYLLVPPYVLPLYTKSLGLSNSAGAGLVAAFNLSSAIGRLTCGFSCDKIGSLNTLFLSLLLSALSMLVLWPISTTLGPLVVFCILNGIGNGGFFASTPTVATSLFGSLRVGVALGMIVVGWIPGYLMGAPIAGYLLAAFGGTEGSLKGYHPTIFFAGSMALASALLVGLLRLRVNMKLFAKL